MANTFLFGQKKSPRGLQIKTTTVRDFSGGWNVVDNDLNLTTKYAKILRNVQRSIDGGNEIRFGTRLFADCSPYFDKVIEQQYYNGAIIAVGNNGNVVKIDAAGIVTVIFNEEFASKLPGSPNSWTTTSFASFAVFNGELIICNGVNKPLIVNSGFKVTYLNDLATGSNANTPIGRYVITHGRYLIIAGNLDNPDRLYISALDTSGTWVNDPAPNDAVNVDLGSLVPSGSQEIKGLGRFRDRIVVAFEEALLPGQLGTYVDSLHNPTFDDAIENFGSVSHRVIQTIGEDMFFCDGVGVNSVSRALFTGSVKTGRASELVDPEIQKDIGRLKSTITLEEDTFSVYDSLNSSYMLFLPNADDPRQQTMTRAFVYKRIEKLKVDSWFEYTHWKFQSATRSALKRIFFSRDASIFILGSQEDPIYKDYEGEEEMFSDNTPFTDYSGFTPVGDINDSGISIPWVWELPWADNGQRYNTKSSKFLGLDTQGKARFNVQMFIDNIREDKQNRGETYLDNTLFDDGTGFDVEVLNPALEMSFVGGDYDGFGADEFGQYYGGGRPTQDERLYKWPSKYKLQKFRFYGDGQDSLKFVSLTIAYLLGSIRR